MIRNILLVIIIVLLLWSVVILCDIRQALWSSGQIETRLDKNELPKKPGKLVPNPVLPQWEL